MPRDARNAVQCQRGHSADANAMADHRTTGAYNQDGSRTRAPSDLARLS